MMRNIFLLVALTAMASCGKKGEPKPEPIAPSPAAAMLSKPLNNEECTTGTIISATESSVLFTWLAAANADSYEIALKNLEANTTSTQTVTTTSAVVTLKRNTPYSWYILSKSGKTNASAKSEVWKLYNSGPGASSYAPFPAEIISPTAGQTINAVSGKITLDWEGSDVDNDILSYDVYFGTATAPAILKANIVESLLTDVTVSTNTVYYWKVVSRDSKGNTSDSGISIVKVN